MRFFYLAICVEEEQRIQTTHLQLKSSKIRLLVELLVDIEGNQVLGSLSLGFFLQLGTCLDRRWLSDVELLQLKFR